MRSGEVLDDVASVDAAGVPRAADGGVVRILDMSTTIQDGVREWAAIGLLPFLRDKSVLVPIPLSEYGDTPEKALLRVSAKTDRSAQSVRIRWSRQRVGGGREYLHCPKMSAM